MKLHSRILSLLTVVMVGTFALAACSDDDDNGTGPGDNGPAINMDIFIGSYYNYNVWDLDENNQKVGDPKEIRVTYLDNGVGQIDGYDDFVYLKETNLGTGETNDPAERAAMRVAQNSNYYIHSFQNRLFNGFFDLMKMLDESIEPPAIVKNGYKGWDCLGDFNDANGNAHAPGYTWSITDANIDPFTFNVTIPGFPLPVPVTVFPKIEGVYDGVIAETINLQNRDITQWQVRIMVTLGLRTEIGLERDVTINQTITFSDDPSCQIQMTRESATIDLTDISQELGKQTIPGEKWELKSFVTN